MYIDRDFDEYPYYGEFYEMRIDETKPLDEQVEEKVIVLQTSCDIQESSHSDSGNFISADYSVYIPFDEEDNISLKNGMSFNGDMYGFKVNGKIVGVFPSQLNGIKVYIQDTDV